MAYIRCECCKGTKRIMSLGTMYVDCDECKGVGFVDIAHIKDSANENIYNNQTSEREVSHKRKGRKPRISEPL